MTKDDTPERKVRSAYERAKDALLKRQEIVAEASQRRYYERGLITDNGERGSAQKCNVGAPFEWDDLSALMMDYDALAAHVRELEGRVCERCERYRTSATFGHLKTVEPHCTLHHFLCVQLGNTCGAFKEKTDG